MAHCEIGIPELRGPATPDNPWYVGNGGEDVIILDVPEAAAALNLQLTALFQAIAMAVI